MDNYKIFNKHYLNKLPKEQFDALLGFLEGGVSCGMEVWQLIEEMKKIEPYKKVYGNGIKTYCDSLRPMMKEEKQE